MSEWTPPADLREAVARLVRAAAEAQTDAWCDEEWVTDKLRAAYDARVTALAEALCVVLGGGSAFHVEKAVVEAMTAPRGMIALSKDDYLDAVAEHVDRLLCEGYAGRVPAEALGQRTA
jgi:hypothetical protein